MTGSRNAQCRFITDSIGRQTSAICPFGLRTATAQFDGPRIITPSRTACPPIGALISALGLAGLLEAALEALDATAGVHQLLLARVERVAVRAHLDVQLGLGRARLELVPAGAVNGGEDVLGMDLGLHRPLRIATAVSVATLPPETTATTFSPGSTSIFPARSAAVEAAPAASQASFARVYRRRIASSISASLTSTTRSTRSRTTSSAIVPAKGAARPSAIEAGATGTGLP